MHPVDGLPGGDSPADAGLIGGYRDEYAVRRPDRKGVERSFFPLPLPDIRQPAVFELPVEDTVSIQDDMPDRSRAIPDW